MKNKNFSFYTAITVDNVLSDLNTQLDGLTEKEVSERLAQYGYNEIKESDITWLTILKNQIISPFMCIFFIIGLSYLFTAKIAESMVIFVIILVNVATGFYQE